MLNLKGGVILLNDNYDSVSDSVEFSEGSGFYGLTERESYYRARIMLLNRGSLLCDQDPTEKKYYNIIYNNRQETIKYFEELGLELIIRQDLREPYITWRPNKNSRFGSLVQSTSFKRDRSVFYLLLAKIFYNPGQGSGTGNLTNLDIAVFYKADLLNDFKKYVKFGSDSVKVEDKFKKIFKDALAARFIRPVPGELEKYRIHSFFASFLSPEDYIDFSEELVDYANEKVEGKLEDESDEKR